MIIAGDKMKLMEWEEYAKIPKFRACGSVPAGFEIVTGQFRSYPYEIGSGLNLGREEAGVALWASTDMSTEEQWDDEILLLNGIHKEMGELNDTVRAQRCYISSYELMHYQHNKAVRVMVDTIAGDRFQPDIPVGWFVTWWPPNQSNRIMRLEAYIEFIKAWEQKQKSLTIRTSKQFKQEVLRNVYAKLGEWSNRKRNYVLLVIEKLESFANTFHYPELFYTQMELSRYLMLLRNKMDQLIIPIERDTKVPRTEDTLIKRIEDYKQPVWYHGFFNELDSWLEFIGKDKKIDFAGEEKKRDIEVLQDGIEFYNALSIFLPEAVSGSGGPASISATSKEYLDLLHENFKNPSKIQLWLLACLWKSLKEQLKVHSTRLGQGSIPVNDIKWLDALK